MDEEFSQRNGDTSYEADEAVGDASTADFPRLTLPEGSAEEAPGMEEFIRVALEITDVSGEIALLRVAKLLRSGGWDSSDIHEVKKMRSVLELRVKIRAETRKHTARLCNIVAKHMYSTTTNEIAPELHLRKLYPVKSLTSEWAAKDRFRERLTRSITGIATTPLNSYPGKLEEWMVVDEIAEPIYSHWNVGDHVLVWWCNSWHAAVIFELGGTGTSINLRLRLVGYSSTSDLWVPFDDWSFRLRPLFVTASGAGNISKGTFARIGNTVSVDFFDCMELPYWRGDRLPSGIITKADALHDTAEIELTGLAATEKVVVPQSLLRQVSVDDVGNNKSRVMLVRNETWRILDAMLAGAALDACPIPLTAADEVDEACRNGGHLWCGMRVISGHRFIISVLRREGSVYDSTADVPVWYVRLHDISSRQWYIRQIPHELLVQASSDANGNAASSLADCGWNMERVMAERAASMATRFLIFRSGALEWALEHNDSFRRRQQPQLRSIKEACTALPASFPMARFLDEVALHERTGLVLRSMLVDVSLFPGVGGGAHDESVDGLRLAITIVSPPSQLSPENVKHEVLVIFKQDWQWLRPRGANAGMLPGLRLLTPNQSELLFFCLLARLDTFEGSVCLRMPHRTLYPLGFVPFRSISPPSGENAWTHFKNATPPSLPKTIVWRASCSLKSWKESDLRRLEPGEFAGRWGISFNVDNNSIRINATKLGAKRSHRQYVLLISAADWAHLGFGPLSWLSLSQIEYICRRISHTDSGLLFLCEADHSSSLLVDLKPLVVSKQLLLHGSREEDDVVVQIFDEGSTLKLVAESQQENMLCYLSARDLVSFIPSLQTDPFGDSLPLPTAAKSPQMFWNMSVGLGPTRHPTLIRRERPGLSAAEICVDDEDYKAAWEEIRLASALRDLEPAARIALAHRLVCSLRLSMNKAYKSDKEHSAANIFSFSCSPPLPSSVRPLDVCNVLGKDVDGFLVVRLSPPIPLIPGAGSVETFTIQLFTVSLDATPGIDTGYAAHIYVNGRGLLFTSLFTESEVVDSSADLIKLWQNTDDLMKVVAENLSAVRILVELLQKKAGGSNTAAVKEVSRMKSNSCFDLKFPDQPVPIFVHEVESVTFVRTPPLVISAFDTGRGLLLIARARGTSFLDQIVGELDRIREDRTFNAASSSRNVQISSQQMVVAAGGNAASCLSVPSPISSTTVLPQPNSSPCVEDTENPREDKYEVEVARVEIPRIEYGVNREPLLMTIHELDRLLLGWSSQGRWRILRKGLSKSDFLGMSLGGALQHFGEVGKQLVPGLAHSAAPLSGGSTLAAVSKIHPDGFVDVQVQSDRRLLYRINPNDVWCPVRSDRKLRVQAHEPRDHHPLRPQSRYQDDDFRKNGYQQASISALHPGMMVLVMVHRQHVSSTKSTLDLQYHRGEEEYVKQVSGDSYLGRHNEGSSEAVHLPEHLRLLLGSQRCKSFTYESDGAHQSTQSASLAPGTILVRGHDFEDSIATSQCSIGESAVLGTLTIQKKEEDALHRLESASEAFYRKRMAEHMKRADETFAKAEILNAFNDTPVDYPDEIMVIDPECFMTEDEKQDIAEHNKKQEELTRITTTLDKGEDSIQTLRRTQEKRRLYLEAAASYKQALVCAPISAPKTVVRIAISYLKAHEYKLALAEFKKCGDHFPNSTRLLFFEGQAYLGLQRFDEARFCFDRALEFAETDARKSGPKAAGIDFDLLERYRLLAVKKHKKFDWIKNLGEIEVESKDLRQRDIDQQLNRFNIFDSLPSLTKKKESPHIEPPSKMLLPIASYMKKRDERRTAKKNRRGRREFGIFPPIVGAVQCEGGPLNRTAEFGDEEVEDLDNEAMKILSREEVAYSIEGDDTGVDDEGVLFEMEIETKDGSILELTILKNDDPAVIMDHFSAENPNALSRRDMAKLKRDVAHQAAAIREKE